jgi:ABC transport system ATP-binding/permease protein
LPILTATQLEKAFGVHTVLAGVDLSIHTGERIGLVGANGSGKSTLGRILAGRDVPDRGNVARRRTATIAYLDQEPTFEGSPTARGAVLAGLAAWSEAKGRHDAATQALTDGTGDLETQLSLQETAAADVERLGGWDVMHQVDSMLGHLGIERPDADVATLSGGERRRIALARILISRPSLAVLDEPTNHLDVETVDWLEGYLRDEFEGALLLVTHDRYLLDRVAERTLELDQGKLYAYDGGYELYLQAKAERLAHEARTEQNRQNFLRRELEWLARQPKARTTKQKARIERAESAKGMRAPKEERTAQLSIEETRSGKTILELRNLALDVGGKRVVQGLDLFVTQGERIGVVGRNGTGKTTLLRAIMGVLAPSAGSVVVGENTKIAYFDQERSGLDESASVFDNVAGDQPKIEVGGEVLDPRSYLERFLFDRHKQRQEVSSLSGGERARVALAKMLRQKANLVLLDEPTNDLDVGTLSALEGMLIDFAGSAIVVTHDRWFLDRVATSILAFEGDGRVVRYPGNYETLRRLRAEAKNAEPPPETRASPSKPAPQKPKAAKKGLTFAEQKELDGIMDAIEKAEARVTAAERRLSDPALYSAGGDEVKDATEELSTARVEAARLVARWEELEGKRAEG